MSLENTAVLIIGGTSGIGLGVAVAVAERSARPIVVSRRQSSVDRALADLPSSATGWTVDLTDPSSLERLAEDVGDIDHLVFTAAETPEVVGLPDLTAEHVDRVFRTRYVGMLLSVSTFAPRISAGGSITLTSGVGGGAVLGGAGAAINAATKALAVELAPLRVNAVSPGPIRTPMQSAAQSQAFGSETFIGRIGEVTETALAYVYFMEQGFGTGVVITVDGGYSLK